MNIQQIFKNKPAILLASGPSLDDNTIKIIEKYKDEYIIFGCNDTYTLCDFIDVFYACDGKWWKVHATSFFEKYKNLQHVYTQDADTATRYKINLVKGKHSNGISTNPQEIHWGSNSGFQQLNLALLMGCSKFILVGYNMQSVAGKTHFFTDRDSSLMRNSPYPTFQKAFKHIQKELKPYIVNCTPNSALSMFRQADLEEELCT